MTEKRRGRPPKAKPCPDCGQTGSHYDDCAAGMGVPKSAELLAAAQVLIEAHEAHEAHVGPRMLAQAYALRVWAGQSVSADRPWRIQRVKEALAGQNLPFDGVELPE